MSLPARGSLSTRLLLHYHPNISSPLLSQFIHFNCSKPFILNFSLTRTKLFVSLPKAEYKFHLYIIHILSNEGAFTGEHICFGPLPSHLLELSLPSLLPLKISWIRQYQLWKGTLLDQKDISYIPPPQHTHLRKLRHVNICSLAAGSSSSFFFFPPPKASSSSSLESSSSSDGSGVGSNLYWG